MRLKATLHCVSCRHRFGLAVAEIAARGLPEAPVYGIRIQMSEVQPAHIEPA
jgi:hypothetical protein